MLLHDKLLKMWQVEIHPISVDQNFGRSWLGWPISEVVGKMLAWAERLGRSCSIWPHVWLICQDVGDRRRWPQFLVIWMSPQGCVTVLTVQGLASPRGSDLWPRRAKRRLQCHGWLAIDTAPRCLYKISIHPHGLPSVEAGHVDAWKQVDMASPLYINKLHSESVFVSMICL